MSHQPWFYDSSWVSVAPLSTFATIYRKIVKNKFLRIGRPSQREWSHSLLRRHPALRKHLHWELVAPLDSLLPGDRQKDLTKALDLFSQRGFNEFALNFAWKQHFYDLWDVITEILLKTAAVEKATEKPFLVFISVSWHCVQVGVHCARSRTGLQQTLLPSNSALVIIHN